MRKFSLRSISRRFVDEIDEIDLDRPDPVTVFKVIWFSIRKFFVEKPGQIIGSAFLLLMLWGTHGKLELLGYVWSDWRGPGSEGRRCFSTKPV